MYASFADQCSINQSRNGMAEVEELMENVLTPFPLSIIRLTEFRVILSNEKSRKESDFRYKNGIMVLGSLP